MKYQFKENSKNYCIVFFIVLFILSPIDVIPPDFIPVLGHADDLIAGLVAIRGILDFDDD